MTVTVPITEPGATGRNCTTNVVELLAETHELGCVKMEKPAPVTPAEMEDRVAPPLFWMVKLFVIGVPVGDISQPIEVPRVVHTFDPCLACAVHLVRPDDRSGGTRVLIPSSIG